MVRWILMVRMGKLFCKGALPKQGKRNKTMTGIQIRELKFGLRTDTTRMRHIRAIQERCSKFSKTSKP